MAQLLNCILFFTQEIHLLLFRLASTLLGNQDNVSMYVKEGNLCLPGKKKESIPEMFLLHPERVLAL